MTVNQRKIENLKVFFRERPVIYKIARLAYLPMRIIEKIKLDRMIAKEVSEEIEHMKHLDRTRKYVFYTGIPNCSNLGDLAMTYCIRKWVGEEFKDYTIFEMKSYPLYDKRVKTKLQKFVSKDDIFITQPGAVFAQRNRDHRMHLYLLKQYPQNRILFMPGSTDSTNAEQFTEMAMLFNANKRALLLARDPVSYEVLCKKMSPERVRLFPDIVTSLIGCWPGLPEDNYREGVLVCKRIDGEKVFTDKYMENLLNNLKTITDKLDITDMMFEQTYEYVMAHAEETIAAKLRLFSSYQVIMTDRLHGMIYALISNTPVIVLPTYNHKVSEVAKWLKEYYPESVYFCETLEEAEERIKELLQNKPVIQNESVFKEMYYDKLKEEFDSVASE